MGAGRLSNFAFRLKLWPGLRSIRGWTVSCLSPARSGFKTDLRRDGEARPGYNQTPAAC